MKRKIIINLLLLVLMSCGCNDYTIKTKINPDGSFEKTIVCDGDSLGIYQLPLPFVFSNGWKIDIQEKSGTQKGFITTATKKYAGVEELQAEYTKGKDSVKLNISSRIEKRFRWFFTYYIYEETIPAFGLFMQSVPIDSFFTPKELGLLKDTKDSLLKKRYDDYHEQNIAGEFIENLIVRSQELNDPLLSRSHWEEHRKSLTLSLLESEKEDKGKGDKTANIERIIEKTFQTSSVRKLRSAIDTSLSNIMRKMEIEGKLGVSYKNEVVMPGILITSNSEKVEGNKLMWDCKPDQYFDVVMTAESRMVNVWAMIVTVVVCAALLVGLLFPLIRLKKKMV
ncbi:MAG: hypothetical protein PHP42_13665 [Bacteroidota bacterium]|nr:hypothetical protein [Bacteroidota bacterium]